MYTGRCISKIRIISIYRGIIWYNFSGSSPLSGRNSLPFHFHFNFVNHSTWGTSLNAFSKKISVDCWDFSCGVCVKQAINSFEIGEEVPKYKSVFYETMLTQIAQNICTTVHSFTSRRPCSRNSVGLVGDSFEQGRCFL